ncbi:MAG: folate family ECF transporter S component [Eubacteriales bacterium]
MENINLLTQQNPPIWSRAYWREAAAQLRSVNMLAMAALIVALRVAVKFLKIPLAAGLSVSLDCYVNSLGSLIYGPLMGLLVGAVSDTVGCPLHGFADYFFPFILTEMFSSFIFGLFFWRRPLGAGRALVAKFTVNLICNIILTSVLMKWYYYLYFGVEKAEAYNLINMVRIVKNLVLFPVEAVLITVILSALLPALRASHLVPATQKRVTLTKRHILLVVALSLLSVGLVLFYIFFLKDFVSSHNIKLF